MTNKIWLKHFICASLTFESVYKPYSSLSNGRALCAQSRKRGDASWLLKSKGDRSSLRQPPRWAPCLCIRVYLSLMSLKGSPEACNNYTVVSWHPDTSFPAWLAPKPRPQPAPSNRWRAGRGLECWWPSQRSRRSKVRSTPCRRSARSPPRSWGEWRASNTHSCPAVPERSRGSGCASDWRPCCPSEAWAARERSTEAWDPGRMTWCSDLWRAMMGTRVSVRRWILGKNLRVICLSTQKRRFYIFK